nr:TLC domain-containing protein fld-1-like [Lytechinus pictus]
MMSSATVLAISTSSALGFSLLNALLRLSPPPMRHVVVSKRHKWRNEVGSLVHSVIVGLGSLYCLTLSLLSEENVNSYFADIEIFGALSVGYTIYDTVDLLQNESIWKVLGLFIHHIAVCGCFILCYQTGRFYHLCIFAMMVDCSSIFLHLRMLLIMHGFDEDHPIRTINTFTNVVSFAVFRLVIIVYILVNVLFEPDLPGIVRFASLLLISSLLVINLVLFKRLIVSDLTSKKTQLPSSKSASPSSCNNNVDILDTS